MAIQHRKRAGALLARGLGIAAATAALVGCDLIPGGGYDVVPNREREPIAEVAAPPPPPYVAGVGAGPAQIPQLAANAPAGVTQAMVEEGAELYGTVCAACHGAAGQGTGAAPSLADAEWIHITGSFDEIVNLIHTGVASPREFPAAMPALGGGSFNQEQVRQIAAYVFALSHQ